MHHASNTALFSIGRVQLAFLKRVSSLPCVPKTALMVVPLVCKYGDNSVFLLCHGD